MLEESGEEIDDGAVATVEGGREKERSNLGKSARKNFNQINSMMEGTGGNGGNKWMRYWEKAKAIPRYLDN